MIQDGDRILVAFSGGKDSYALLSMLLRFQKKAPVDFSLFVAIIDSGFGTDFSRAERFLKDKRLHYIIKRTRLASVLEEKIGNDAKTGSYCFLCSRMRRGVLYKIAMENKCSKIALGHNLNDAVETLLMNIFFGSRSDIMPPKYTAEDGKNIIIRPLITVPEPLLTEYARLMKYRIMKQDCPYKKKDSKRALIKKLVNTLCKENRYSYSSIANALVSMHKD
jgi:tRNA 2-thiocytidine biosynthesis protein TtcA